MPKILPGEKWYKSIRGTVEVPTMKWTVRKLSITCSMIYHSPFINLPAKFLWFLVLIGLGHVSWYPLVPKSWSPSFKYVWGSFHLSKRALKKGWQLNCTGILKALYWMFLDWKIVPVTNFHCLFFPLTRIRNMFFSPPGNHIKPSPACLFEG